MSRIVRQNRFAGARIEHIVADLRGVEDPRINHPVKCWRITDCSDAAKASLALLPQSFKCRHDLAEHGLRGKAAVAAIRGDMIVELKKVDMVQLQALQARFQRR